MVEAKTREMGLDGHRKVREKDGPWQHSLKKKRSKSENAKYRRLITALLVMH